MANKQSKKCEHEHGYYQYAVMSGKSSRFYTKEGEFVEANYDSTFERDLKTKYCEDCDKRIK